MEAGMSGRTIIGIKARASARLRKRLFLESLRRTGVRSRVLLVPVPTLINRFPNPEFW